jgi:hypothetical protein
LAGEFGQYRWWYLVFAILPLGVVALLLSLMSVLLAVLGAFVVLDIGRRRWSTRQKLAAMVATVLVSYLIAIGMTMLLASTQTA